MLIFFKIKPAECISNNIFGSWDVFIGPLKDQSGKEILAAGAKMSAGDMLNMSFFVEGVIGKAGN